MLTVERLQIMLDRDLYEELCRRALDQGVSKAELIRRAVRAAYPPTELPPLEQDPLFELFGLIDVEPAAQSEPTVDEVIYGWEFERWQGGPDRRRGMK